MKTGKRVLFPGKVNDSVLTQLEMVHNFVQVFKMQAIQGDSSKKRPLKRLSEKSPMYCLISDKWDLLSF